MAELECEICYFKFDESDNCPRMLQCGHTYCHECIGKIIEQNSICPKCNKKIKANQAHHVPKNFYVLSLRVICVHEM